MISVTMEQEFHRMTLHETRNQMSPQVAKKPQSSVYRAGNNTLILYFTQKPL